MTKSNLTKKRLIWACGYSEIESIVVEKAMQGSESRKLTYHIITYTQEVGWDYKPSSLSPSDYVSQQGTTS